MNKSPFHASLKITAIVLFWVLAGIQAGHLHAQQQRQDIIEQIAPRLFLDCSDYCFENYIRSNINFITFVRDQTNADIHLLITQEGAGNGGTEYTFKFLGRGALKSQKNTLTYTSVQSDTDEEIRSELVRYIKIGLVPYLSETRLIQYSNFEIESPGMEPLREKQDRWNNWIFEIDLSGEFSTEERRQSYEFNGGFDVNRITREWKIDMEIDYDLEKDIFEFENEPDISSNSTYKAFEGLVVKSLDPHWSAGISSYIASSTFSNIELELSGSTILEYNIFPYREYNRRELRIQYRVTPVFMNYRNITIFHKSEEVLLQEQAEIILELTETWGSIEASVEGSHYFHDISKNRFDFNTDINLRIYRGLSFSLELKYALINDQITLPKEDLDNEEVILMRRELATSYALGAEIGINYSFGSIYNNIVNPRID